MPYVSYVSKGSCQRLSLREFQARNYLKAGLHWALALQTTEAALNLKDLKAFSDSLNQPLNIVRECMSQAAFDLHTLEKAVVKSEILAQVDQGLLGALQITQTQDDGCPCMALCLSVSVLC